MNSKARVAANARFHEKLKQQGQTLVSVRLSARAVADLDALAEVHGSRKAAVETALGDAAMQIAGRKPTPG